MPDAPLDARERADLCHLLLDVGPEAPTLCEGWTALDMAAHLVVRENDLRAGFVILGGERFAGLGAKLMGRAKAEGLEPLVDRLRSGPPAVPWRVPGLRTAMNLNEWFVHHEDVRRANGASPRSDRPDLDDGLWRLLRRTARLMLARARGAAVTLAAPGFGQVKVTSRRPKPLAQLTGGPQELVLYLNGRRTTADVELSGDPDAVAVLERAHLGI